MAPRRVTVFYAHPYPQRSRAGRALIEAVRTLPFVSVRSLYSLYPDFSIDVDAERAALNETDVVVWQAPFYWYGLPAMMSHWIEKVLAHGFAYGEGGNAVRGKTVLWVTTTGAPVDAFRAGALHGHPFETFVPPIQQTALFCGMRWSPPLVLHGAHRVDEATLTAFAGTYRQALAQLAERSDG